MNLTTIESKFIERFSSKPQCFYKAPGRINLIGEHTDYNEGFVLPAAIDKEIVFAISPNHSDRVRLFTYDFNDYFEFSLQIVKKSSVSWVNYILGVIAQFQKNGYALSGFDCVYGGDVPSGAGLSSSAAVECGLAFALNDLFSFGIDKMTLAKMAQKAEHEFVGVFCGIMDQFASIFGREGYVVRLDCRSLEYVYFPFDMSEYKIVLCDTQVKHSLASSEYNTRRYECEQGVLLLQKHYPFIQSLRDVSIEILEKHKEELSTNVFKRCLYVVKENMRVLQACQALEKGDLKSFGQLMYASHEGLSKDYQVSCKELDFLVEKAQQRSEVIGSRMMGGGFGGCTINLVKKESVDSFVEAMSQMYQRELGKTLKTYITTIQDGAKRL
ncbi:MAG: galactokinase [Cytophagales bacterium]|nr:galactokinase [Cytophagales bacterium]MDW8384094.1 galactokinase [Flammeovirgaceae bacterium]